MTAGDRTVNYDPHNTYNGGGGYYDGYHPWAAGAAGLAGRCRNRRRGGEQRQQLSLSLRPSALLRHTHRMPPCN